MSRTIVLVAVLCAACGIEPSLEANPASNRSAADLLRRDGPTVKVMTRNLYLGADILAIADAAGPEEALLASNRTWAGVQSSDGGVR